MNTYLEASTSAADGGELVGRLPSRIDIDDLRALGHSPSPTRAIREKCIDCSGGNAAEARKCVATGCALWAFRMGRNPFYGKSGMAAAEEPELDDLAA